MTLAYFNSQVASMLLRFAPWSILPWLSLPSSFQSPLIYEILQHACVLWIIAGVHLLGDSGYFNLPSLGIALCGTPSPGRQRSGCADMQSVKSDFARIISCPFYHLAK